jgi:hypothetical protein
MQIPVWKTTLATLVLVSAASRLQASSEPPIPPTPPIAPAPPQAAPAPPAPPEPPAPPHRKTKRIVVSSPEKEKEIFVDGDRVFVWNDGDAPGMIAGVDDFDGFASEFGPAFAFAHGRAGGGFIGVQPIEMTPELRQHFGAPKDAGVLVGSVEAGGPAAKGGLQVGDIVTAVDGERIASAGELVRMVRHRKTGETIAVAVLRDRTAKNLKITVAERADGEIRVGELGRMMPPLRWKAPGHARPMIAPALPDYPELQQRLDELEKRLKELEGRTPAH